MPQFNRYIGIDYSGAETADSSCKGIRVYVGEESGEPIQIQPPPSPRRYWTRRGLAVWLREELDRGISNPCLTAEELGIAKIEGWILGVV